MNKTTPEEAKALADKYELDLIDKDLDRLAALIDEVRSEKALEYVLLFGELQTALEEIERLRGVDAEPDPSVAILKEQLNACRMTLDSYYKSDNAARGLELDFMECPNCNGTGESSYLSDNGPDAYEIPCDCPHCNGTGTLEAAYKGVCGLLEKEQSKYLNVCRDLWAKKHLPAPSQPAALLNIEEAVELAKWRLLLDPNVLHANLVAGQPAKLTREHLLHLLGTDAQPAAPVALTLTDAEIAEIAERMEASDPTASFWREFAREILALAAKADPS